MVVIVEARKNGQRFDLALVDANMPAMDGFAPAERSTGGVEQPLPTIMMLTSLDQARNAIRSRQMAVSSRLLKPILSTALRDAMLGALGRSPEKPASTVTAISRSSLRPLRILLAEDNVVNQRVAIGLLEQAGHAVTLAVDGREALTAVEKQTFDLVLMDIQMPEMSGWEATAAIRAQERGRGGHVPIIALTAHAMAGDRGRCVEAGADGYVCKPIKPLDLFHEIAVVLSEVAPESDSVESPATHDDAELLERVGGSHALLQEIIGLFLEDCPRQLGEIRQALAANDAPSVYRATHTLKGSAGNFGAQYLMAVAQHLEARAREENLPASREAFATLEYEAERLMARLTALKEPRCAS
jgi:CheY-like chemotaxis protein